MSAYNRAALRLMRLDHVHMKTLSATAQRSFGSGKEQTSLDFLWSSTVSLIDLDYSTDSNDQPIPAEQE